MSDPDDEPDPRTVAAIADAARLTGARCSSCGTPICGHEAVFALVLGYKAAPRCLGCTATHMKDPVAGLRERALGYVQHHDCFHAAWRRASELERSSDAVRPDCVFAVEDAAEDAAGGAVAGPAPETAEARWDAGGMGCGDLVLELRQRLTALPPGGVLRLRAEDPGAPIDLPAWCGVTGHTMLDARHPEYRIRRRS